MPGPAGTPRSSSDGTSPMSRSLLTHRLIAKLVALDLPPDDYAVFGSGPLLAHRLPV